MQTEYLNSNQYFTEVENNIWRFGDQLDDNVSLTMKSFVYSTSEVLRGTWTTSSGDYGDYSGSSGVWYASLGAAAVPIPAAFPLFYPA